MSEAVLRPMVEADLETVLGWRNHPTVRCYMFDSREIGLEEHRAWFCRRNSDPEAYVFVFDIDATACGFVQLQTRGGQASGEWGFYAAPGAPKGTGRRLGHAAIVHAFQHLGWHKISGTTLASNEPSIRMHKALGFQLEGTLREHHFDGVNHVDVYSFGLLQSEWNALKAST